MEFPCCKPLLPCVYMIVALLLFCRSAAQAQLPVDSVLRKVKQVTPRLLSGVSVDGVRLRKVDSSIKQSSHPSKDTVPSRLDSVETNIKTSINGIKEQHKVVLRSLKSSRKDKILIDTTKLRADSAARIVKRIKRGMPIFIIPGYGKLDKLDSSASRFSKDSLHTIADSLKVDMKEGLKAQKKRIRVGMKSQQQALLSTIKFPKIDSIAIDVKNPFKKLFTTRPILKLNGGTIWYYGNYRAIIDTPYAENNILQHNITGSWNLALARVFPLQVNYWLRQSNSQFFKNTVDVQVVFNSVAFLQQLKSGIRERLLELAPAIKEPRLEKDYLRKLTELAHAEKFLKINFSAQKIFEAKETILVPKITWDVSKTDSVNLRSEDSLKGIAKGFLHCYDSTKKNYDSLHHQVDLLKEKYDELQKRVRQYQQLVGGNWDHLQSASDWKNQLQTYGLAGVEIPTKYRWLLGLRNFSLGRSPVNYSELTAKNLSVNGINLEYNSWYYFALTAGMVNYRFRDFVVANANRKPQYLAMARAGLGRLENNYFILSALRGQKQLFASSAAIKPTIPITNLSVESRWAINRTSYLVAEIGKSITPDFRNNPPGENNSFKLSNTDNQAFALHLFSQVPVTNSKVEAFYKKAGANYQSFNSYATNTAQESWYIKADQNLFKRKLHIAAALRKNEFINPFIQQDYKSNTVFKSVSATLRIKKWPVFSIGYQPMSQYTKMDEHVIENRFQSFNAMVFHYYTVHQVKMATTVMVNKFLNNTPDTSFLYYKATNSYLTQAFYFSAFTANAGISFTRNSNYTLAVIDGGIQPIIPNVGTIGAGIKINNLNNTEIKAGGYVSANIRLWKQDMLLLSYEHGYLPGNKTGLVRNETGTVQFIKKFNFK